MKKYADSEIGKCRWLMTLGVPVRKISEIMLIPIGTLNQIKLRETHKDVKAVPVDVSILNKFVLENS